MSSGRSEADPEEDMEVTSSQNQGEDEANVAANSKRSLVWDYFVAGGTNYYRTASCKICSVILKLPHCTTTPMFNHLKAKHTDEWKVVETKIKKRKSDEGADPRKKRRKTEMSGAERKELDELLMEMIAVDLKPFSCIEDRGFLKVLKKLAPDYEPPHRTTFSRSLLPILFHKTKETLINSLSEDVATGILSFSFTTDGWKSRGDHHYLSLTTQYMSKNFEMKNITLGMAQLEGPHTGILLRQYLEKMMDDWRLLEIEDTPMYFVTDNARNISAAVNNGSWNHVYCFAHTLQLAVKDAKRGTDGMAELLVKARRIATHFHHSDPSRRQFEAVQREFGDREPLKLIQMVETRWNSEYEMIARMQKLKGPLTQVLASSTTMDPLTGSDWKNICDLIQVLKPLYDATVISCGMKYPTLSMVIPILSGIKHALENQTSDNVELGEMADELSENIREALDVRFTEVHSENLHKKATFLDPRYRGYFFKADILKSIESELSREIISERNRGKDNDESGLAHSQEPSVSKEKSSFWDFMRPPGSNDPNKGQSDLLKEIQQEMVEYVHGSLLEHYGNPFSWWKEASGHFPNLSLMARRYLPIPATSVESERLFSSAGDIVTEKRTKLLPDNVEYLIFLYKNLE